MHTHAPASELHRLQQHVARVQRERGLARDATAILASASGSLEQRARECLGVRELAGHQVPLRLRKHVLGFVRVHVRGFALSSHSLHRAMARVNNNVSNLSKKLLEVHTHPPTAL